MLPVLKTLLLKLPENNRPAPAMPVMAPVLVTLAAPPLMLRPMFWPVMAPALLQVPPPLAMMPGACWLTMVAPALLVNVVAEWIKAPRPPTPLAVIDPVLVIGPSVFPRDVIP